MKKIYPLFFLLLSSVFAAPMNGVVASPDGRIAVAVGVNAEGVPVFSLVIDGSRHERQSAGHQPEDADFSGNLVPASVCARGTT